MKITFLAFLYFIRYMISKFLIQRKIIISSLFLHFQQNSVTDSHHLLNFIIHPWFILQFHFLSAPFIIGACLFVKMLRSFKNLSNFLFTSMSLFSK